MPRKTPLFSTSNRLRPRTLARAAALLALLAAATPAPAQDSAPPPTVTLRGRVTDASTGQALPFARIEVVDVRLRAEADEKGEFVVKVPAGAHLFRFAELGYDTLTELWTAPRDDAGLAVELTPRPVLLAAVRVQSRALERRLDRVPFQVRAFDRAEIRRYGHSGTLNFLALFANLSPTLCNMGDMERNCAWVRGGAQRVNVFIDEQRALGGMDQLRTVPLQDIHRIEVIAGGSHVRVYTRQFMQDVARRPVTLAPIMRGLEGFQTIRRR